MGSHAGAWEPEIPGAQDARIPQEQSSEENAWRSLRLGGSSEQHFPKAPF